MVDSPENDRIDGLDALWPAGEPCPDFVSRTVARIDSARPPAPPPRRWTVPALAGLAAVAVICATVIVVSRPGATAPPARVSAQGSLTAQARTTVSLGDRGVAVAHAGAVVAWSVAVDGRADVHQIAGEAFYRVEPGGRFVVRTPAGEVRVTGTCFTVAVADGVTTVDVHEGSVELADAISTVALAPGERGHLGGDAPARRRPPPRSEALAPPPRPSPAPVPDPRAGRDDCFCFSDPRHLEADQALLDEWAGLCRVRADVPPALDRDDVAGVDAVADQLGLTGTERSAFHKTAAEYTARGIAQIRELYVAATGDADGADQVEVDAQIEQILQTATLGEDARLRDRLSQERAGHLAPPTETDQMSPFEELFRLTVAAGDEFERLLASRIGADRARELRMRYGGWPGPDFDWFGCP
jgi:hypothetical protein